MNGNNKGRRNWTFSMTIAVAVAGAAAVIGCLTAEPERGNADRAYFKNTAGSVLFDHGKHGQIVECATCHHELLSGRQSTECTDCHDEGVAADDFEHSELKQFHNRDCLRCHELVADQNPTSSCRDCHSATQENEQRTVNCRECHDDGFSPEIMAHDEYLEIEDHTCLGCHNPDSISGAYHINCTGCHLAISPEKFADNNGAAQCSACHLR